MLILKHPCEIMKIVRMTLLNMSRKREASKPRRKKLGYIDQKEGPVE